MKKIINGLRYDTDNAVIIGSASYGYGRDFSAWDATLYKTPKSGRFFLAGEGGPMTIFGRSTGQNETQGGTGLIPMDKNEALAWAEHQLTPEEVEKGFGTDVQDA